MIWETIMEAAHKEYGDILLENVENRLSREKAYMEKHELLPLIEALAELFTQARAAELFLWPDDRLNYFLTAYLLGITKIDPIASALPFEAFEAVCQKNIFLCRTPEDKGYAWELRAIARKIPNMDKVVFVGDPRLDILTDALKDGEITVYDLDIHAPYVTEVFEQVFSSNEKPGCIGCLSESIPYDDYPIIDAVKAFTLDDIIHLLAVIQCNNHTFASACWLISRTKKRAFNEILATADDLYLHLLSTHPDEAQEVLGRMAMDDLGLHLKMTEYSVAPWLKEIYRATKRLPAKCHAVGEAALALVFAAFKAVNTPAFYIASVRRMNVEEDLGGLIDDPDITPTYVLMRVEQMLGVESDPLAVVQEEELMLLLRYYEAKYRAAGIGRKLLLLMDVREMNCVEEVWRDVEGMPLVEGEWNDESVFH